MKNVILFVAVIMLLATGVYGAGGTITGLGTAGDPFLIEDIDDFKVFANSANSTTYWVSGVHTKLTSDIDLDPALPGRQTYTIILPKNWAHD